MTMIIKEEKVSKYHIEIRAEGNCYKVMACEMEDEERCSYPKDIKLYTDLNKAERRYNTLKRRYGA